MRKKTKIKLLEFEILDLTLKLSDLKAENEFIRKYNDNLENSVIVCSKTINDLKTKIHLLKRDILSQNQLIEIKDEKIKKLESVKEKQNKIIQELNKENYRLKDLVKTNKDARTYLRGKSERE